MPAKWAPRALPERPGVGGGALPSHRERGKSDSARAGLSRADDSVPAEAGEEGADLGS